MVIVRFNTEKAGMMANASRRAIALCIPTDPKQRMQYLRACACGCSLSGCER
jgi:hypothetical protein